MGYLMCQIFALTFILANKNSMRYSFSLSRMALTFETAKYMPLRIGRPPGHNFDVPPGPKCVLAGKCVQFVFQFLIYIYTGI
jgi:hypothetical protein